VAESHEPSYYEIALTNRQVIVAFTVLLICLLSAFFSGVWIGRESTARATAQELARNASSEVPREGQNLEELEFFGARDQAAEGQDDQQEASPSTDTTLLEDLSGGPPAELTPAPEPEGEPEPATGNDDEPARPAADERRQERRARAEETPARENRQEGAPARTAPPPAEPALPKGSVVIQVFSSADQEQSERIRDQLIAGGHQAYLSPVERGGRTMFRVRLGPFASRAEADKVSETIRKVYKLDTWVTE
jgi:cell division protein FtsN